MKKQLFALCILVLLVASALSVSANVARAAEKYLVAGACYWPPMEFLDDNKVPRGYSFDLLHEMARVGGFEVEIRSVVWENIFASVALNRFDLAASSCSITEDRLKHFDFTDPYCEVRQSVVVPAGKAMQTWDDLQGKIVGGQVATTGIFLLRDANVGGELREYENIGRAMRDLASGRIDAVICDSPVAMYFVNTHDDYAGQLKIAFEDENTEYLGFVVKKGRKDLLDKLNASLKKVREAGIDRELAKKWFGTR